MREPDDETLQAVAQLLRELVEADGRRQCLEAVRPRNTADVVTVLNAGVITLAEARRYPQTTARLQRAPAWLDLGLIFTDTAGRPLDIRRLRKFLYAALDRANVRRRKLYSLRHTMASLMLLRR